MLRNWIKDLLPFIGRLIHAELIPLPVIVVEPDQSSYYYHNKNGHKSIRNKKPNIIISNSPIYSANDVLLTN